MKTNVKISNNLIEKLQKLHDPCFGKLYGIVIKDTIYVLGLQVDKDDANILYSFPNEVDFCGLFQSYLQNPDTDTIIQRCNDIDVTDTPVFLGIKINGNNNHIVSHVIESNKVTDASYVPVKLNEIYSNFVHVRIRGNLFLNSEASETRLQESFNELSKDILSGTLAFKLPKGNVILTGKDTGNNTVGLVGDPTLGDILELNQSNEITQKKRKVEDDDYSLDIINLNFIKKVSNDKYVVDQKQHAPVVVLDKKLADVIKVPIKIDFLSLIQRNVHFSTLYNIMLESILKNLNLFENCLYVVLRENEIKGKIDSPETLHFFVKECGHFVTQIVFNRSTEILKKEREALHDILLISKQYPVFRKGNKYQFYDENRKK